MAAGPIALQPSIACGLLPAAPPPLGLPVPGIAGPPSPPGSPLPRQRCCPSHPTHPPTPRTHAPHTTRCARRRKRRREAGEDEDALDPLNANALSKMQPAEAITMAAGYRNFVDNLKWVWGWARVGAVVDNLKWGWAGG